MWYNRYNQHGWKSMWQEMSDFQSKMDRLFSVPERAEFPPVNVYASGETVVVTAEVPGVPSDELQLSIKDDILTLGSVRPADASDEKAKVLRRERTAGRFSRTIQLPYRVNSEGVEAQFKNGLLAIKLPRAESDKPRKIVVKAS